MKKILALVLALILALSLGSVAFAKTYGSAAVETKQAIAPGDKLQIFCSTDLTGYKVATDFTSATIDGVATDFQGASYVESVKILKDKKTIELTLKESFTLTDAKDVDGWIKLSKKGAADINYFVELDVNNATNPVVGVKKLTDDTIETVVLAENTVNVMDEDGGYVAIATGDLAGTVKMEKNEKAQVYTAAIDEDTQDAIDAYLGEDYEGIVEWYNFAGNGFKSDVAWTYDAYAEDPHFFYAWDGEKFVDLEAKFNDDEDVDAYEFTAAAKGVIIVTDVELVAAAEETKNPDTGANDVVGVAAALAVVSLVAAGAVSLKK